VGKKKLAVITPAFVSDCLETLEEIAIEGKKQFLSTGGEQYKYIPCMNENEDWVTTVSKWISNWEIQNN
jgi:ferrochelatase